MPSRDAAELKAEGAIEAAQSTQTREAADAAQNEILEQSKRSGVPAFSFDPDASAAEKRAQARNAIPAELRSREKAHAIVSDIDDGTGPDEELPEAGKGGAIDIANGSVGRPLGDGDPEAKEEPFSRTGWAPMFGPLGDKDEEFQSLLEHATWLEGKLPDQFYGDWYHNAAMVVFACLASWLVAVLGGGLGWLIIVMAFCSTYYRTSLRRVRRNFRDDIHREMALKRLDTDNESLEWINSFLVKFWPIYQPVLAQTIVNSVDQVLSSATPSFLDSLKLKTFTLGTKPPRMEHVKTYPRTEDDIVMMDWKFSFTPNDTVDMTARQLKNKINPKVVLEIRVGKAMISKGLDVIVEDMAFSGIMRLKIKLQLPFPHIDRVEMCFLERPTIDYVCKPLGGETLGFDINFIPGLESFIQEQIHGNLAPMMYAPKTFPIEVAKMLAGNPVDQAVGVLAVTLHGANALKNTDNFAGTVDPYVSVTLNQRNELARTKTVEDNSNPRWNETHYIVLNSFTDSLDLQVFDKNDFRKSKMLGVASFPLENVEELNVHENLRLEVISDGKVRGNVSCDLRFFPVLEPTKNEEGVEEPPPESNQGILRFTVQQAKDLDGTKSLVGMLNPYACLFLNGKEVHQTKKLKRTNNPIWDNGSKEILITDRRKAKLGVSVKDDRDLAGDQDLGKYQIKLDDMLELMQQGKEWYHLSGASSGRVHLTAQWRPVAISGVVGSGGYVTPIGVMRLHFKKATDLRNLEAFGKSDAYMRVLLSGIDKGRTVTFFNDLNPEWDEVLYVPVHSPRDKLTLEAMDTEKMGSDRSLGLVDLYAGDYIRQVDGEYVAHDLKEVREDGLRMHGKGMPKGTLTYTVAFYPCLNVADPDDDEEEKAEEEEAEEEAKQEAAAAAAAPAAAAAAEKPATPTTPTSSASNTSLASGKQPVGKKGPPKLRLSPEELLRHESGLLIFKLMEADMPDSNTRLEIFVDDYLYPAYTSSKASKKSHTFDEIGDCVIRELDFSKLTIKARKKGDDSDKVLASVSGNTLDTLKQCLNNPTTLKLKPEDGGPGSVKVSLKYIPIKMQLDASESINNMGKLRVDLIDGVDLPAADRNGKSDPFCKFELNDKEVYKSEVQKKTLNPKWNESFDVDVPSRTAAQFKVDVYDWDLGGRPDFLGGAPIPLDSLEPFRATEVSLPLDGKSGSIRVRLVFRPDYVRRSKRGTATFGGGPGRIVTGVAGVPFKGGAAVASGVGRGATFLRRGLFSKKDDDAISERSVPVVAANGVDGAAGGADQQPIPSIETSPPPPNGNGAGNGNGHARTKSFGSASIRSNAPPSPGSGTAIFTVVGASGYPASTDLYVTLTQLSPREKTVGKTRHHKSSDGSWTFDESFKVTCTPDVPFKVEVKGEHTLRSDDDLGEHAYFVDESGSGIPKELSVGGGTVTIKSTFQPAEVSGSSLTESPRAVSRRSFLGKRDSTPGRNSREPTPA
ncbi:Ca2+-dependent lipid-binding protein, contains C2 domain [Geosmithia morbida]|uniref:Ca2+-dependent lipid-binding protein, contains C2 domain n=1 Tax=Geosmithia morbida TaxID=1094350 RepID=A0A9P4YXF5_9HYPO|nr:Ca2+-dependent lipid-binding protein, contains C2 domain [Geosmithia morbida]KAF4123506.1 Ca2+-dependent lipid-binding protein, contains C2 domain [Geosmithia morbida]